MHETLSDRATGPSGQPFRKSSLDVVIVYEDFESGKQAQETCDFLRERLRRDCRFSSQMWKFDVLNVPKLREIAVEDTAMADIIIVSTHGDELPDQVKAWVESWLVAPGTSLALMALFAEPRSPGGTAATRQYLARVATRGHMEFFAQADDWTVDHDPGPLRFDHTSDLSQLALSTLADSVRRAVGSPHGSFYD